MHRMNTGGKQDREKRIWPMELVNDTPLWVRAVMLLLFDALAVYLSSFLAYWRIEPIDVESY